jgi:uncharacterized protein YjdB
MTFMHKLSRRLAQNGWLAVVLLAQLGCSADPSGAQYEVSEIRISPRSVILTPNSTARFSVVGKTPSADGVPVSVTWSAKGGVIDENGVFVAGLSKGTYHVQATHATLQWISDSSTAVVVSPTERIGLRVHPRDATVTVDQTVDLTAYALFANGDSAETDAVTWAAQAGTIERANGKGRYRSDRPGRFRVRAVADTLVDSVDVTVTAAAVASVSVTPESASVGVGGTVTFTTVARDAAGGVLTGRQFSWSSANNTIATVSSSGTAIGRAGGTTIITVTCESQTAAATIVVAAPPPPPPAPVGSVTVTPASASLVVGDTLRLTAVLRDAEGNVLTGRALAWTTGNAGIAAVSGFGKVNAVGTGTTGIVATSEGRADTATILVTAPPPPPPATVATVTVTPTSASLNVGQGLQFTAVAWDSDGNRLSGRPFSWASTNATIASVSGAGWVSALGAGTTAVAVTCEGKSTTATITVAIPPPPPSDSAAAVFQDGFESGTRSGPQNGYAWGSVTTSTVSVSSDRAFSGTYSLKFSFGLPPDLLGDDSWAEARLGFGEYLPAVWLEYRLYVPANFTHRNDQPANNKFFMIWRDTYGSGGDWRAGYEYNEDGNGGSRLRMMSNQYTNSVMTSNGLNPQRGQDAPLINGSGPIARGAWTRIRVEFRAASGVGANDGVMRLWAGNVLVGEKTDGDFWNSMGDAETLLHNCYILGWANSGFAELTEFFVDDVKIYNRDPNWTP